MLVVLLIDVVVLGTLVYVTVQKGVERSLPYFVFFVVLFPEESRIRLPGLLDLYTHRVALVVLLMLFLIFRKKPSVPALPIKRLIYLHVFWALISTVYSIVFVTSTKQLLAQVLEYYLLYYILVKTISDVRSISRILYAMIAAMAVCCVFGLLEIYAHWSILSVFPAELQLTYGGSDPLYSEMFDRGIRARSTYPHPILFGGALAMTIPLAFYLSTCARSSLHKAFLNVSLLLMFWNLYKTASRGPWLATGIALAILTCAARNRVRKRVLGIAVLAIAIMVLRPGIAQTLMNIYRATLDPESRMGSSFQYRPALFHTVTSALNENPGRAVLGYGLGSFREKGLIIEMPDIETHRWYTCDSSWILFAYETGYPGLLILAALLWKPASLNLRMFRRLRGPERYLSLILCSSLIAFYVVMISVAIYGWGQNGYMLWTIIALSVAYAMLKNGQQRNRRELKTSTEPRNADGRNVPEPVLIG